MSNSIGCCARLSACGFIALKYAETPNMSILKYWNGGSTTHRRLKTPCRTQTLEVDGIASALCPVGLLLCVLDPIARSGYVYERAWRSWWKYVRNSFALYQECPPSGVKRSVVSSCENDTCVTTAATPPLLTTIYLCRRRLRLRPLSVTCKYSSLFTLAAQHLFSTNDAPVPVIHNMNQTTCLWP